MPYNYRKVNRAAAQCMTISINVIASMSAIKNSYLELIITAFHLSINLLSTALRLQNVSLN